MHSLQTVQSEQPKHTEQRIHIKQKLESHRVHHDDYPNVAYYHTDSSDLYDGISKTPTGAILSVSIGEISSLYYLSIFCIVVFVSGMIIFTIMALIFGCRLKMVRRRIRKDGKGFTHDPDFLVNGMYL